MEKMEELKRKLDYDAIVVGSGYGGSVAACRMSAAGIKVCLLEKGRRWTSEDFPTDSLKIMSAARYENCNLGLRLGQQNALFQIHEQKDSLAFVVSGLGGGSLVNAGVMLTTPPRARNNPKWPMEWERDWDVCQATAAGMLGTQNMPVKFPAAKVMGEVLEGHFEENSQNVKATVSFDVEEPPSNSLEHRQQMSSCVACGNCVFGCPYNAKNSTDKNYLLSAIKAGCEVRTECQVRCVVANPHEKGRRWRVYFNDIDYITADFVILSAGVLGTTEILFQSEMRGLSLSEALGSGFSTNGNMAAYLGGSSAPLSGYGLNRKQLSQIPFQDRPGPSISSSHTSSLGFTIQSAILPRAYPYLLIILSLNYKWPTGDWSFHGIINHLKTVLSLKLNQSIILCAMGHDEGNGKIMLDKGSDKICFDPPRDPLVARKVEAFQKLTKKVGGTLYLSMFRSTAVHLLGGCIVSSDSSCGVCNHNGQVFDTKNPASVHAGLYVCDASLIPCSVGVNPSLTIATAAEHVSKHLVQEILEYKSRNSASATAIDRQNFLDSNCVSTVLIKETMRGHVGGTSCTAYLTMKMMDSDQNQEGAFNGCNQYTRESQSHPLLWGKVGGYVVLRAIEKDKLHVIDGKVDMCVVDCRTPYTQYMYYRLLLAASSGSRYILEGRKIMSPYLYGLNAWKETRTLHVTFKNVVASGSQEAMVDLKGELSLSFTELLKSIVTLQGNKRWKFINLLLSSFFRTYILQIPQGMHFIPSDDALHKPYPSSILHEIRAGDGHVISCRQWKRTNNLLSIDKEKLHLPVLLLNGYSTESYMLSTEPHDLVRTLLEEGHEVWLLQYRLHPLNPTMKSTIEEIGKYDIPSAINKILQVQGPSTKIHVVAHCVGGLSIHIALMGGHVSANRIASLSCTNSSMFFKLTTFSRIKMWLPLLPILKCEIFSGIPRYERCTCKECEIFSGIFGNTFWHENVSPSMHHWLNKISSTSLPMSAFPHLRKICKRGYIVDSNGSNSYLIHPERMALPTLYISGGRSLLVTPETSFLANKYMKLHQPAFRHERVVIDGFGHSDLLIGEKSHEKVFPQILSHIRLAEQDKDCAKGTATRKKYSKAALDWDEDPHGENDEFGRWFFTLAIILVFLLLLLYLFG